MKTHLNREISSLLSEYGPVLLLRAIAEETKNRNEPSIPLDMEYAIQNIKRCRREKDALRKQMNPGIKALKSDKELRALLEEFGLDPDAMAKEMQDDLNDFCKTQPQPSRVKI